jgi:FHA domain
MDGQKWILYVTDGSEQERVVPLSSGHALTIGRSDTSGLRLTTPSVSRNHALLEWHLDRPFLSDRGSTHGTRIGEEAVTTPRELRSGDTIHLADATLRIVTLETSDLRTATLPAVAGPESSGGTGTLHGTKASPRGGTHGSSTVTPWHQRSKAAILGAGALAAAILGVVNLWAVIFPPDPADVAEIESVHVIKQLTLADFAAEGTARNLSIRPAAFRDEGITGQGTSALAAVAGRTSLPTFRIPAQTAHPQTARAPIPTPTATTSGSPSVAETTPTQFPTYETSSLRPTPTLSYGSSSTIPVSPPSTSTTPSPTRTLKPSFIVKADIVVSIGRNDEVCGQARLKNLKATVCSTALRITLLTVDDQGGLVPPPEAATALENALSEVEMTESEQGSDPDGWTLAVRLDLEGLANQPMLLSWSLDGRDIPEAWQSENLAYKVTASTPHDAGIAQVWIPNLERPGPYNVNIRLSFASDGTIADTKQLLIAND